MKSGGNFSRLSSNVSQDRALGSNTTAFPTRLMNTSSPEKRNSLGSRTAWLSPFLNSFADFIEFHSLHIYLKYILFTGGPASHTVSTLNSVLRVGKSSLRPADLVNGAAAGSA